MQVAIWTGQGEGTQIDPFILNIDPATFQFNNSFNIRMENNYLAFQNELNYFKFNDITTVMLLALIVKDGKQVTYYKAKDAIGMTSFLSDRVDFVDGPFILTTLNGVHYLLKQQVFSITDVAEDLYVPVWTIGPDEPQAPNNTDFWFDTFDGENSSDIEDLGGSSFIDENQIIIEDLDEIFVDENENIVEDLEFDPFDLMKDF